jgi:hypothetical protein
MSDDEVVVVEDVDDIAKGYNVLWAMASQRVVFEERCDGDSSA